MWVDDLWGAVRRAMALSVAVTLAGLVTARNVDAQAPSERVLTPISRGSFPAAPLSDLPGTPQAGSIRRSLERLDYRFLTLEEVQAQPSSRRSVGRKILGGALGGPRRLFRGWLHRREDRRRLRRLRRSRPQGSRDRGPDRRRGWGHPGRKILLGALEFTSAQP